MKLYPGFREEYRKRHNEIWPELVRLLKETGVGNYSIWLDEETNTLFAYQEQKGESSSRISGPVRLFRNGEIYGRYNGNKSDNSPVSIPLKEVFYME